MVFKSISLIDSPTIPAYFPWYIEEGGAEFGGIVLSAKYANLQKEFLLIRHNSLKIILVQHLIILQVMQVEVWQILI